MKEVADLYYQACVDLGLNPVKLPQTYEFKIKVGQKNYYFDGDVHPLNNASSVNIARNKYYTNRILHMENIPVPEAIAISKYQFENNLVDLNLLPFPVTIKPAANTGYGRDVLCNIKNPALL